MLKQEKLPSAFSTKSGAKILQKKGAKRAYPWWHFEVRSFAFEFSKVTENLDIIRKRDSISFLAGR